MGKHANLFKNEANFINILECLSVHIKFYITRIMIWPNYFISFIVRNPTIVLNQKKYHGSESESSVNMAVIS